MGAELLDRHVHRTAGRLADVLRGCLWPGNIERVSDGSRRADPAIKFPTVSGKTTVVPVPSDLLFAFDSAALSASGQAYLGPAGRAG